jgi:hypothetical protein
MFIGLSMIAMQEMIQNVVILIEQLGLEGYGIFWMIIETLRDQPGYQYPLILIPALRADTIQQQKRLRL